MGRGQGGSTSYGKRTPGGIKTSSKMSKVGEIEAKHGVLGEEGGGPENFLDSAQNLTANKVSGQRGSNPGGTFEAANGQKNYVKVYRKAGQAYGEAVANNIYNALGLAAPKSVMFDPENPETKQAGRGIANEYMAGTTLQQHGVTQKLADQILDGAAADILLANWDTIGLVNDNILVTPEGKPVRIDNGGSLLYRAQGANKPEPVLNKISEWDVFANDGSQGGAANESYADIIQAAGYSSFDDIMPRMREQVEKINQVAATTNNFEDLVPQAPGVNQEERARILEMLQARKDLLNQKVGIKPEKRAGIGASSAMRNSDRVMEMLSEQDQKIGEMVGNRVPTTSQKEFKDATFPEASGLVFASPNREDEYPHEKTQTLIKPIKRAELRTDSDEQEAFNKVSQQIDSMFGLNKATANAIGVWSDGAENSTATKYSNGDPEKLKVAAAMKGLLGEQKQVALFTPNPDSPVAMYEFNLSANPAVINHLLKEAGFEFHTLIPINETDTKISIIDFEPSDEKLDSLQKIAYALTQKQANISQTRGDADFIGNEVSRQQGADEYEKIITNYFEQHPEDLQKWLAIKQDWKFGENMEVDDREFENYKQQFERSTYEKQKKQEGAKADKRSMERVVMHTLQSHILNNYNAPKAKELLQKAWEKYRDGLFFKDGKIPTIKQLLAILEQK